MTDFNNDFLDFGFGELVKLLKESSGKIKEKIKQVIRDKINSNHYLISISEEETKRLYEITKTSLYRRLEECLGSHWSMNLIALGLYVAELNENQYKELQEKVRGEVHQRYFYKGMRILEMGSTGAIREIIDYLSGLKVRKNYNFIEMGKLFDKIIEKWDEITIFIKAGESTAQVELKCLNMLEKKFPLFFVFAYGSSTIYPTIAAIAKLNIGGNFKGYLFETKTDPNKNESYSCSFESVENLGIDRFS